MLAETLTGSIYVAMPFENPFDSLLALYIVVKSPQRGIIVKLAGDVKPDPQTGQLTTTFNGNPQLPFSSFTLELRQGATSPLVSPPVCGQYAATAALTPWSAPTETHLVTSPPFEITQGVGGGAVPGGWCAAISPPGRGRHAE